MTRALALADFTDFKRSKIPQLVDYVCLTEYNESFDLPIAFAAESYPDILSDVSQPQVLNSYALQRLRSMLMSRFSSTAVLKKLGLEKTVSSSRHRKMLQLMIRNQV